MPSSSTTRLRRSEQARRLLALHEESSPSSPPVEDVTETEDPVVSAEEVASDIMALTIADDGSSADPASNRLWKSRAEYQSSIATTHAHVSGPAELSSALHSIVQESLPSARQSSNSAAIPSTSSPPDSPPRSPAMPASRPGLSSPPSRSKRSVGEKLTRQNLTRLDRLEQDLEALRKRMLELDDNKTVAAYMELNQRLGEISAGIATANRNDSVVPKRREGLETQVSDLKRKLVAWKENIVLAPSDIGYNTGQFPYPAICKSYTEADLQTIISIVLSIALVLSHKSCSFWPS